MKKYIGIYFYKKILLTKKKYNVKIIINYGKLMFTIHSLFCVTFKFKI